MNHDAVESTKDLPAPSLSQGQRRLALGLYALATPLAFPHALPGGGAFDAGLLATWCVPMFLVLGLSGLSVRDAGREAFGASMLGHVVLFHWFFVVTVVYGHMPAAIGVASPLVPALYVSIFTSLFGMGWSQLSTRALRTGSMGPGLLVSGAALWVALDYLRAHFLGGFPWATLGYGLHQDIPLLGLTRWTGVYGLSFVAVVLGLALAFAWLNRDRASRRLLVGALAGVVLLHGLGAGLQSLGRTGTEEGVVEVAAIQGNVDQGQKWDEARRLSILGKYLGRSAAAAKAGAEWIIWPETAVPGLIEFDPMIAEPIRALAKEHGTTLFVGGMGYLPDPDGGQALQGQFFDSAFAIDARGEIVDRYDKTELVPFGEFVPFRALLGHIFKALATGLSNADVTAGPGPRVLLGLENPKGLAALSEGATRFQVGVPICYELIFPHAVRGFAADGADVLLAMTNDAWYGRTGAPHQFLAMTAMRAAENGLFLVRSANTGISAIIDERGQVLETSELFEDATVAAPIPLSTSETRGKPRTIYARFGDVFAGACLLLTGLRLLQAAKQK